MKFLDANIRRPLASVSAMFDERNVVVFGPQDAYVENTSTGQRNSMNSRNTRARGAAECARENEDGEVRRAEYEYGFQAFGVNKSTEELRECCQTKTELM